MKQDESRPPSTRPAPVWLLQLAALLGLGWLIVFGPAEGLSEVPDVVWGILLVAIGGPEAVSRWRSK